ncbi:Unknown protein [Striga hermonthica]|uniref:Nuclease associated modular domain-containing protein n=1 Tax=Striga hermonthica TaxID=68872 RepID=A0A9N7N970_STRHE|nr:Unknown protein [Striga hermonthica]
MPLLDIAISQPWSCYSNNRLTIRSHAGNKYLISEKRGLHLASAFSWKTVCDAKRWGKHYALETNKVRWSMLRIKAFATLETTSVPKNNGAKGCQSVLRMDMDSVGSNSSDSQMESSSEDSTELDERERLRRMKISEANKGKTPWNKGRTELDEREKLRRMKISEANRGKRAWNKGRKHSPETLQKIKERTWVAMQDPKVKMKLLTVRDPRSKETKIKIGVGVRLGWERRRQKLMVQETCHHEWQNLIALAAKGGLSGEKELQWDSYQILNEEFVGEWLKSTKQKKSAPKARIKGNMRAPKSAEHKRKIAEAIAAKWADPVSFLFLCIEFCFCVDIYCGDDLKSYTLDI